MKDVFISYAREDLNRTIAIAKALESKQLSVWFDRDIPIAAKWENVLTSELEQARCVVMLWSKNAAASDWVRKEGLVGLERAVLVPVQLEECIIPDEFRAIQFADFTSWNDNELPSQFSELLKCVQVWMSPRCQISFQSIFEVVPEHLTSLYDSYFQMAARIGCVPASGRFRFPENAEEDRKLHRAVASLQVTVDWHHSLVQWFSDPSECKHFAETVCRIERQLPSIWLRMLSYSGPFASGSGFKIHQRFLCFASMMLFHHMVSKAEDLKQSTEITWELTETQLGNSSWAGLLSAVFDSRDEVGRAYVTHIDDNLLSVEEVYYGPQYYLKKAYGRSIRDIPFTDPVWFEQYFIPQRELRLALEGSSEHTVYRGNLKVRKITDLEGNDLEPVYE